MRERIPAMLVLSLLGACAATPVPQEDSQDNPDPAEINFQLGVGYIQAGRFDLAQDKLQKALEYNPQLAEAHNALAILYEETGERKQADQEYQQAIQKNPQYALARLNYGRFLCNYNRANEGEGQFLLAAANPELEKPEQAYIGAGICARNLNALQRADRYFRKALEIDPLNPSALLELANVRHQQGENIEAREFLQRYHRVTGDSPASLWLGIGIEKALGEERLRAEYERLLLSKYADSPQARQINSLK